MKKVNTYLFSAGMIVISAVTISIGATAIRTLNSKAGAPVIIVKDCASQMVDVKNFKGEWIPFVQLPEVTVAEQAMRNGK